MNATLTVRANAQSINFIFQSALSAMRIEHAGYYGQPCGVKIVEDAQDGKTHYAGLTLDENPGCNCTCFSEKGYHALGCPSNGWVPTVFRWATCRGNILEISRESHKGLSGRECLLLKEDSMTISVTGRRHGIPWRFLGIHPADLPGLTWEYQDSQRTDIAPWETTS